MSRIFSLAVLISLLLVLGNAQAARLEVNGGADLDADFFREFSDHDEEEGDPLVRPAISVAASQPGVFSYFAAADIRVPKLQVAGSWSNSGGALGNHEGAILFANARITDTITITAPTNDPYVVTVEMLVSGTLDVDGTDARAQASLLVAPEGQLSTFGDETYDTNGVILNDVISATYGYHGDAVFNITSALFMSMRDINAETSMSIDFSNTAILNIKVFAQDGTTPINGFTLSSESGQFGVTPVPLPAALPLFFSGVAWLGWRHRGCSR